MFTLTVACENCGGRISHKTYETNGGFCLECKKLGLVY